MTSTIKPNESSALFSLQQLMDIEEERLQQEEAERVHKIEAARKAEREASLRRQQEEEARVAQARAEEDDRRRRDREHQVQMEAMRAAIIEQQRIKTERLADQQKDALRMENEREMARIAQQSAAKKLRRALLGVSLGAAAIIAGGLGLYFGKIKPDNDLKAEAIAQEARDAQQARASAERDKAAVQAQIDQLQRELLAARTPAERADISDKINTLSKKTPVAVTKTTPKIEAKSPGEVCQKGDPMCKQLPLTARPARSGGRGRERG